MMFKKQRTLTSQISQNLKENNNDLLEFDIALKIPHL